MCLPRRSFITIALAIVFAQSMAQENLVEAQLVHSSWKAEQRKVILKELSLEGSEKAGFWDIYDSYSRSIEFLEIQYISLMDYYRENFKSLEPKERQSIGEELLQNEQFVARRRLEYYRKFCKALPVLKADKFMVLDDLFRSTYKIKAQKGIPIFENVIEPKIVDTELTAGM